MSEPKPKPIYETGDYWQKVAAQERKKAADNLRTVAEQMSEIAKLNADLMKTDEDRAHWMSKCSGLEVEIEQLRKLISAARYGFSSYAYGNTSPKLAQEILEHLKGGE